MPSLYERDKSLALNAIVRNAEKSLQAMLDSVLPYVDEAVIVDNGSTDGTRKILDAAGVKVIDGSDLVGSDGLITSFADARNRAVDATRAPYIVWLDADDVLVGGKILRELAITHFRNATVGQIFVAYWYAINKLDEPTALQLRERIFRKRAGRWKSRVHEAWIAAYAIDSRYIRDASVRVEHRHRGDTNAALERNLRILEKMEADDPSIFWHKLYIGKTYLGLHRWKEAVTYLSKVANEAPDTVERFEAAHMAADALFHMGFPHAAREYAMKAFLIAPSDPRVLLQLSRIYYHVQRFKESMEFAIFAQHGEFAYPQNVHDPAMRNVLARIMEIACLNRLGRHQDALKRMEGINELLEPGHPYEAALGDAYKDAMIERMAKEYERAFSIDVTADPFSTTHAAVEMKNPIVNLTGWGKLREFSAEQPENQVDIFCGDTQHPWTGTKMREGHIGGAEVAVVRLAEGLNQKGWNVRIYNGRKDGTIIRDHGVEYAPSVLWNTRDTRRRVIYWRAAWALDYQLQAQQKILWLHDAVTREAWAPHRTTNVDTVVAISDLQVRALEDILGDRVVKIPNFVPWLPHWDAKPRTPHSAIWTSAPYRGLDLALELWPEVRERVPDAVLKVTEPFGEIWEMYCRDRPLIPLAHHGHPVDSMWLEDRIQVLLTTTEGVERLPVLDPPGIAQKLSESEIWLYTSVWPEMCSCASIEAQLYGAVPVCPRMGGLAETVKAGFFLPDRVWEDKDSVVDTIVEALTNDEVRQERRELAKAQASAAYSEHEMILRWDELLRSAPAKVRGPEPTNGPESEAIIHAEESIFSNPRLNYIVTECRRKRAPRVLDLGTGDGWTVLAALLGGASEVRTIDKIKCDFSMIKPHLNGQLSSVTSVEMDLDEDWPDGEWDIVIAEEIAEHVKDPKRFIARLPRLLARDGVLIFTVPYYSGQYGRLLDLDGHRWLFTSEDIRAGLGRHSEVTTDGNHLIARLRNVEKVR